MKKLILLTMLGISTFGFAQRTAYFPSLNKTYQFETLTKNSDENYTLTNAVEVENSDIGMVQGGGKEIYGTLGDFKYLTGCACYQVECRKSNALCFRAGLANHNNGNDNTKYITEIPSSGQYLLSSKKPSISINEIGVLASFDSEKELNITKKEFDEFGQQVGGGPKEVYGILYNIVNKGTYYFVQCINGPGYCIRFEKAPLNFYPNDNY